MKRLIDLFYLITALILVGAFFMAVPRIAQAATFVADDGSICAKGRVLVGSEVPGSRHIGSGVFVVDLPAGADERAEVARLNAAEHVKFAEFDCQVHPAMAVNDPYFGAEWHLTRIGAPAAWDTTQGGGVIIAILDTGTDCTHPDLAVNCVPGWNFWDNNSNTADVAGHGTATAGTAAAITNNGTGVAGVAGRAKIMPIRISDAGMGSYYSLIAQGITYAADHGARVANISYTGLTVSSAIQSAAQYMKNKGGLVVVAAGNNGINENLPSVSMMIPVAATLSDDTFATWSSYGTFVAMSAPGYYIYTTKLGGTISAWWGTSFSSPIVAGTIALMMSTNPLMSNLDVERVLYATAVDLGSVGRDIYFGYGRVDAAAAVLAAAVFVPPPVIDPPPAPAPPPKKHGRK